MTALRPVLLAALAAASLSLVGCGGAAGRADQPNVGGTAATKAVLPTVVTTVAIRTTTPVATSAVAGVDTSADTVPDDPADASEPIADGAEAADAPSSSGRPAPVATSKAVAEADRAIDEADALLAADV
jgi:hypothetical protein